MKNTKDESAASGSLDRLVRCFCTPAPPGGINRTGEDVIAWAIDEEGKTLSSHYCSNDSFAEHDIQNKWHCEHYAARYPDGYRMTWLGRAVPAGWATPENQASELPAVRCIRLMGASDRYRVWYDNWDAQVEPVSIAEAVDDVESELGMCSQAMLVTRGDLSPEETLRVVDNLRKLIVTSIANHGDSPITEVR